MALQADCGQHGLGFACIQPQYAIADVCVPGMVSDTSTRHASGHIHGCVEWIFDAVKLRFGCAATHERANVRI